MGEADIQRLAEGETVVSIRFDEAAAVNYLFVIIPLNDKNDMTGALYTRLNVQALFSDAYESGLYQEVQSFLIDGDRILFTNYPSLENSPPAVYAERGLIQSDMDEIAAIIKSPELDSTTFFHNNQTYFISAIPLSYNRWHLLSCVRGPDVLLRSSDLFGEVVATSSIAILLTAGIAYIMFLRLRSSRKRLEEEQKRNDAYAQRLKAMFEQHTALKVVFDAATGEIVDANLAILHHFGYTRKEVIGRTVQEFNLLPPELLNEKFQGELNAGTLFSAAPHLLRSGETRFLDVYASVIMDNGHRLLYAILVDVTDREQYRKELLQEKELLRTTLRSIGDGVVTTDAFGIITDINSVAESLTGWDKASAIGKPFAEVFILQNEDTGKEVENPIQKVLETGRVIGLANHTELVNRQSGRTPIADSAAPIKTEDGETLGVVMVFRDVSDEKEHSKEIKFLSYHDSLTGLYNRRHIEETMTRIDAEGTLPVSVIMGDVNGLKITNDVFGHQAGDALLKSVAELMKENCNGNNLIARWGGDEFVILMPGGKLKEAEAVIHRIKEAHIEIEESSLSLSISLGCASKDSPEISIQSVLQQAEENMYQQKLLDGKSYRNAIISTLLATLYEKSQETEEHSKRLEKYCHAIGRKLQLSSKEMDELSLLALLHDIGKVGIHPNILKRPGSLTPAEWGEMKRHPEIGYRIAQATPELAAVADLILSHHERWDGKGYPRSLKGEEIPIACRILSVVDAYDAMTNDRVYRKAMTSHDAIQEIRKNMEKQFDPQIAELFIEILAKEKKETMAPGLS